MFVENNIAACTNARVAVVDLKNRCCSARKFAVDNISTVSQGNAL
jgi:hypothetical protein